MPQRRIYDTPAHRNNRKRLRHLPCTLCGLPPTPGHPSEVDHIIDGAGDSHANTRPLCKACNIGKRNRKHAKLKQRRRSWRWAP